MSQVIFSRKIIDKKVWVDLFDYTNNMAEFKEAVASNSTLIRKTTAFSCPPCNGIGSRYKKTKAGTDFTKASKCPDC